MNSIILTDFNQAQMAKEMNARLIDIKAADPDIYAHELGKCEAMLTVWLIRMGELNE